MTNRTEEQEVKIEEDDHDAWMDGWLVGRDIGDERREISTQNTSFGFLEEIIMADKCF